MRSTERAPDTVLGLHLQGVTMSPLYSIQTKVLPCASLCCSIGIAYPRTCCVPGSYSNHLLL